MTTSLDTNYENELSILIEIHRFEWLTNNMLAGLIWPDCKYGIRIAQRLTKALVDAKYLDVLPTETRKNAYVLAPRGAHILGEKARKYDENRTLKNQFHRLICNYICIECASEYEYFFTEYEIITNRAPYKVIDYRVPDLLSLEHDPNGEFITWYEIENSFKSHKKLQGISTVSMKYFCEENNRLAGIRPYYLDKIVYVCPTERSAATVKNAYSLAFYEGKSCLGVLKNTWIMRCEVSKKWDWGGCSQPRSLYSILFEEDD